jgi:hypothetical protein
MDVMPSHTLSLIFVIAVVASIVVQACVFLGLFIVVAVALKKVTKLTTELSGKAMPIVGEVRAIVQDLNPKIKTVSGNVVDITSAVREQTQHVNTTVEDVVDRTRAQAVKVDDMVSAVLGSISHAGAAVQSGVGKPVRKAGSLIHALRVGLGVLFGGAQGKSAGSGSGQDGQRGPTVRAHASGVAGAFDERTGVQADAVGVRPID